MRIAMLTGGGDCPGLNPALRGFAIKALDYGHDLFGYINGWKGLVEGTFRPLHLEDVEEIIYLGGTMLHSSRTNPFKEGNEEQLEKVLANLVANQIDAVAAFGGEDTLGVANKLYRLKGVNTVGVPKTMDNDLNATDYTFGFDSASGVATECVDRIRDTARSHNRVIVVEVMGRHAGWVAHQAGIAGGADWILYPEIATDFEEMAAHLLACRARGKNYGVVVASEGTALPLDTMKTMGLVGNDYGSGSAMDDFGHVKLDEGEVGKLIAKYIQKATGIETRHVVLGHIQRGGSPSVFDRVLATRMGMKAADLVHERQFGMMAAIRNNEIIGVSLQDAVAELKTVPLEEIREAAILYKM